MAKGSMINWGTDNKRRELCIREESQRVADMKVPGMTKIIPFCIYNVFQEIPTKEFDIFLRGKTDNS
jgi:hypothetical protein